MHLDQTLTTNMSLTRRVIKRQYRTSFWTPSSNDLNGVYYIKPQLERLAGVYWYQNTLQACNESLSSFSQELKCSARQSSLAVKMIGVIRSRESILMVGTNNSGFTVHQKHQQTVVEAVHVIPSW